MRNRSLMPQNWPRRFTSLLSDDFDRAFQSMFSDASDLQNFRINCDVEETKDHFLLTFDMPGMRREDIEASVDGNVLTVSGERKSESREEMESNVLKSERSYGRFQRSFTLPRNVDVSEISANYENGVLELSLPKTQESRGQTIEIGEGKGSLFNRLTGKQRSANGKDLHQ